MSARPSVDPPSPARDRELGMGREITRRDFLDGVAVGVGVMAGGGLGAAAIGENAAAHAPVADAGGTRARIYPPALTGMRGSAPGSYEVAHALRDGRLAGEIGAPVDTGEHYDLVVVGAGISGLAAAYFHRKLAGPGARILILDNHDDFGGHARRNEFRPRGRLLLSNGGTWSIDSPFPYSTEAAGVFAELGVDPPALYRRYARPDAYDALGAACFFDRETFGAERLVTGMPDAEGEASADPSRSWREFLAKTPIDRAAHESIVRLHCGRVDLMQGLSQAQKKARLSKMSYRDFLAGPAQLHPAAMPLYQKKTHDLYGIGIDAVPALDCWAVGHPGFQGMGLDRVPSAGLSFTALGAVTQKERYFFHFPDGNASVARLLVRSLVPQCVKGRTAEDVVTAQVDYGRLDSADSPVRIRLNSTAVSVQNVGSAVDIVYAERSSDASQADGTIVRRVRAKGAVLACWNSVIPHLCPELPPEQKDALRYGVKVPLVYTAVSLSSARAMHQLGVAAISCPGMYHSSVELDPVVSMGRYRSPTTAGEPVVLRMLRTPCQPGLPARDQQRVGHAELLATSFETFERNIRDQLARVLGSGGFDPARDIDAITVNRWPHGYAYEYNPLWDPDWPAGQRPCDLARRRFGRIAIANSDAAAAAYTDQAMDQAHRAVQELALAI